MLVQVCTYAIVVTDKKYVINAPECCFDIAAWWHIHMHASGSGPSPDRKLDHFWLSVEDVSKVSKMISRLS